MDTDTFTWGIDTVKESIAWVSGFTGLSSLAVLAIGLFVGSKLIKGIIKLLVGIAAIAMALYVWSQLG